VRTIDALGARDAPSGSEMPAADPLPDAPTLGRAIRAGATDLFFNSWRVVPVNLLFGVGLLAVLAVWVAVGSLAAATLASLLAYPIAGVFRLGAMATRSRDVNLSDVVDAWREGPGRIPLAGAAFSFTVLVLVTNLAGGLLTGGVLAWAFATAAFWGLFALLAFGFTFWPLAVDPRRIGVAWRDRVRLAALLLLAHPARMAGLTLALVTLLALSTVVFAAVLTFSLGACALVACRYVLPAADRLEARLRPAMADETPGTNGDVPGTIGGEGSTG
jgi:uncharacterized membrane protein YesL